MSANDIESARSNSRLSRLLQRILPTPIPTVQGRTRLQARINQDLEMDEAQAQHLDEELIDGEMTDEDEQDENEEQEDEVQLNPQGQNAHAEDGVQEQNPPPVQRMAQPATPQRETLPDSPVFHTPLAHRPAPKQPIIPQMAQPHPNTPTRIPLIIPEKPPRVNVDSLPFKLKSFSGKVSEDAEKFLNDFTLFANINQWQPSQTVNCFKLSVDGAARIWMDQLPPEILSDPNSLFQQFKQKFCPKGLNWLDETTFTNTTQHIGESVEEYANRLTMIGAKLGKSDVCLAQQFVRGLSSAFKTHTLSMGPETFDAAVRAATLYQNAQKAAVASDAVDDRIFSLQKAVAELQKKSDPCPEVDQPLQSTQTIPDASTRVHQVARDVEPVQRPTCAYCQRVGHTIDKCRFRIRDNKNYVSQFQQQQIQPLMQQYPAQQNRPGPQNQQNREFDMSNVQCFACKQFGHIKRNCRNVPFVNKANQGNFGRPPQGNNRGNLNSRNPLNY